MIDAPIHTSFVSQNVPVGFADAAEAVERLNGRSLAAGRARLEIGSRVGEGLAGAVWFTGLLHTGSPLMRSVAVDVVVSPWSAGRSEIGLRPLGRMGSISSARSRRFFDAAWSVLPQLVGALRSESLVETPVEVGAAA